MCACVCVCATAHPLKRRRRRRRRRCGRGEKGMGCLSAQRTAPHLIARREETTHRQGPFGVRVRPRGGGYHLANSLSVCLVCVCCPSFPSPLPFSAPRPVGTEVPCRNPSPQKVTGVSMGAETWGNWGCSKGVSITSFYYWASKTGGWEFWLRAAAQ